MKNIKNLKTAVIGVGNMGQNHARIYSQISNLVAISDLDPQIGQSVAKKHQVKYYPKYQQMLQNEKIDAISVVVPTKHHHTVTLSTLKKNIPTLVEKPITNNSAQAKKIIDFSKKQQVYLQVGHIERFNPAIKKVRQLIRKKQFGKIINLLAIRVGIAPPETKNSDVAIDLSIHDVDIFNYLLNDTPIKIHINRQKIFAFNKTDAASMMLEYKQATGLIQTNWITPIKKRMLYITAQKAFAEVDYIHQRVTVYDQLQDVATNRDYFDIVSRYESSKKEIYVARKEPLKEELLHFLNNRHESKPSQISLDALKALELIV